MRVLIAGAGAVGGYFGGLLLRAGRDVTLLARGAHAAALRAHGLRVRSYREGTFSVRPPVVTSLAEAAESPRAPFDLIIVAVKAPDLDALARDLAALGPRLLGERGVVMPLLNGVESEEVLAAALGPSRVVGAVAHVGAELTAPGQLDHTTRGEILVSQLPGQPSGRAREVAAFLQQSQVPGDYHENLAFISWRKLVWNSAFNAVTALTDTTMGAAARHPRLRALLSAAMRETIAVATAEGVTLPDGMVETMLALGEQYGDARTSMHQDVLSGRTTEHDALNGVVGRRGRKHGITTPVNDTLTALLDGRRVTHKT
ncbi:MAG TPA: 2-dehydropantoate 2-reductase [Polyangia bacterium]|nr:2-dehydropantoate 2-reductase [Polyangia bacterium]